MTNASIRFPRHSAHFADVANQFEELANRSEASGGPPFRLRKRLPRLRSMSAARIFSCAGLLESAVYFQDDRVPVPVDRRATSYQYPQAEAR